MGITGIEICHRVKGNPWDPADVVIALDNRRVEMEDCRKNSFSRGSREVNKVFRGVETIIKRFSQMKVKANFPLLSLLPRETRSSYG